MNHHAVARVDANVAAVVDNVSGSCFRCRNVGAGSTNSIRGVWEAVAQLPVHVGHETGAVKTARGSTCPNVRNTNVLRGNANR